MRLIILFFLILTTSSCKKDIETPSFLAGSWQRINSDSNQITYEVWKKDLTGIGFTLQGKDTVFKELLEIVTQNKTSYLKVTGVHKKPTLFQFTQQTNASFTCENPTNNFPKRIKYWMDNNQLNAKISNPDFSVDFVFKKIK